MARRHPSKRWVLITVVCLLLEGEALRASKKDATFSFATREVFRTDTDTGRLVFVLAWTSACLWFAQHILKGSNLA